ncbi:hypothetical protein Franean1_1540 [Parafrankia sp. EAN1pec]|nr:hypothetical protein Franean1_1540 [Frankia sp. EAN1pec]
MLRPHPQHARGDPAALGGVLPNAMSWVSPAVNRIGAASGPVAPAQRQQKPWRERSRDDEADNGPQHRATGQAAPQGVHLLTIDDARAGFPARASSSRHTCIARR